MSSRDADQQSSELSETGARSSATSGEPESLALPRPKLSATRSRGPGSLNANSHLQPESSSTPQPTAPPSVARKTSTKTAGPLADSDSTPNWDDLDERDHLPEPSASSEPDTRVIPDELLPNPAASSSAESSNIESGHAKADPASLELSDGPRVVPPTHPSLPRPTNDESTADQFAVPQHIADDPTTDQAYDDRPGVGEWIRKAGDSIKGKIADMGVFQRSEPETRAKTDTRALSLSEIEFQAPSTSEAPEPPEPPSSNRSSSSETAPSETPVTLERNSTEELSVADIELDQLFDATRKQSVTGDKLPQSGSSLAAPQPGVDSSSTPPLFDAPPTGSDSTATPGHQAEASDYEEDEEDEVTRVGAPPSHSSATPSSAALQPSDSTPGFDPAPTEQVEPDADAKNFDARWSVLRNRAENEWSELRAGVATRDWRKVSNQRGIGTAAIVAALLFLAFVIAVARTDDDAGALRAGIPPEGSSGSVRGARVLADGSKDEPGRDEGAESSDIEAVARIRAARAQLAESPVADTGDSALDSNDEDSPSAELGESATPSENAGADSESDEESLAAADENEDLEDPTLDGEQEEGEPDSGSPGAGSDPALEQSGKNSKQQTRRERRNNKRRAKNRRRNKKRAQQSKSSDASSKKAKDNADIDIDTEPRVEKFAALLARARKARGRKAYRLAKRSLGLHKTNEALEIMTTGACQMNERELAREAFKRLPVNGRRRIMRKKCRDHGIRLGLGL